MTSNFSPSAASSWPSSVTSTSSVRSAHKPDCEPVSNLFALGSARPVRPVRSIVKRTRNTHYWTKGKLGTLRTWRSAAQAKRPSTARVKHLPSISTRPGALASGLASEIARSLTCSSVFQEREVVPKEEVRPETEDTFQREHSLDRDEGTQRRTRRSVQHRRVLMAATR